MQSLIVVLRGGTSNIIMKYVILYPGLLTGQPNNVLITMHQIQAWQQPQLMTSKIVRGTRSYSITKLPAVIFKPSAHILMRSGTCNGSKIRKVLLQCLQTCKKIVFLCNLTFEFLIISSKYSTQNEQFRHIKPISIRFFL